MVLAAKDLFTVEGRLELGCRLAELPDHTRESIGSELVTIDFLEMQIKDTEGVGDRA